MVAGMSGMGFQASAVADAVRIVDDMVGEFCLWYYYVVRKLVAVRDRQITRYA